MDISVVVITRNEGPRLRLCLASLHEALKRMGPSSAEVVVVNDGSLDETSVILERFANILPLTVIHHAQSKGRSASRNAGAERACGRLLLFLDGDTVVAPCRVKRGRARNSPGGGLSLPAAPILARPRTRGALSRIQYSPHRAS
jgi:glycosyltransferase involved in cell wall biosynthesis